jgi:hypothetical protein
MRPYELAIAKRIDVTMPMWLDLWETYCLMYWRGRLQIDLFGYDFNYHSS